MENEVGNKSKQGLRRRRGVLQLRPKSGQDQRWYAPNRDLTVFFPALVRQTFEELAGFLDPAVEEVWTKLGVSDEEMTLMARTFASVIKCVIARGEDLQQALERSGFRSHRAQSIIGMIFLRLMTERFVACYGETLHKGEHDPNHKDLKDCLALLEQFVESGGDDQKE